MPDTENSKKLWDRFARSGDIKDYLEYRKAESEKLRNSDRSQTL